MARIGLTTLVVTDYDEAIEFFVDAVGFRLVEDTPMDDGKRWVVVAPGAEDAGTALLLARAVGDLQVARVGDQTGGRVAFFLESDDFWSHHERMTAAGVNFLESPRDEPYGIVAVFEDLYGNRWDLLERKRAASPPWSPESAKTQAEAVTKRVRRSAGRKPAMDVELP